MESQIKTGRQLMQVNVSINVVLAYYGEYTFYSYSVLGQLGSIIALPFFTYNDKKEQKFEGYLIYNDKDSYGLSESELFKLGVETIANNSLSGMAGKLSPLPYKLIDSDSVVEAIHSLIEKNTVVVLTSLNL